MSNLKNFNTGIHDRTHLDPSQVESFNKDNLDIRFRGDDYSVKEAVRRMAPSHRRVFDFVVRRLSDDGVGSDTHGYIGLRLGLCRHTVCDAFSYFRRVGLLNSIYRSNRSSLYALPECIRQDKTLKNSLSKYLPSLCTVLAITFLMASPLALSLKGAFSLIANPIQNLKSPPDIYKNISKSISYKKTYICKRDISVDSDRKSRVADRNVQSVRNATPEVRSYETREEMKRRRDENILELFQKGLLTREQVEKIMENRTD